MECRRRTNSSAVGSMHRALSVAVTQILRKIPYETDCCGITIARNKSQPQSRPYAFEEKVSFPRTRKEKGTCPSTPHQDRTVYRN